MGASEAGVDVSSIITQVNTVDKIVVSATNTTTVTTEDKKKKKRWTRIVSFLRCQATVSIAVPRDETGLTGTSHVHHSHKSLLRAQPTHLQHKKCLVLDMDETLLHSSFKPVKNADFTIMVEIDGTQHSVYVLKRPFVDDFLRVMGLYFEIVVFTASLSKYADPVLDQLDLHGNVHHRLFRESCNFHRGNYVKDLSRLGRLIPSTLIIDNSPASYLLHPENALSISTWLDDPSDTELYDLIPFLVDLSGADCHVNDLLRHFNVNPEMFRQRDRAAAIIEASKSNRVIPPLPVSVSQSTPSLTALRDYV